MRTILTDTPQQIDTETNMPMDRGEILQICLISGLCKLILIWNSFVQSFARSRFYSTALI